MGECFFEYEFKEDIPISIVDGIIIILLPVYWSLLLSISCEYFVENDINLLLLGTKSYGMNTYLIIIAGIQKSGEFKVYCCYFQ